MKIGFIGQGFIGKNYADDFEKRGLEVVRYSIDEPYVKNKDLIKDCDIVLIAVPTPTTPDGFEDHIVRDVIKLVGKGKIAVIKSTVFPGSTESIQKENPDIFVVHSPEFLREVSAAYDASNPERNIIGIPVESEKYQEIAKQVLSVLAPAPYHIICQAKDAEFVKYAGNCFLFTKVLYMNLLYDLAKNLGCDWQNIKEALANDSRIGKSHLEPVHDTGRGAGGNCFIKDFATLASSYEKLVHDPKGAKVLRAMEEKNIELLVSTNKNISLLKGVYGEDKIK